MTGSDGDLIVRIAAKGDGVTSDGRHIAFSAPGDRLSADGGLVKGDHHIDPACQHFQKCGGCSLQQLDDQSYARFVTDRVKYALEGQGLAAVKLHEPKISKPKSRVRASLRAAKLGNELKLGFSGAGSHRIIDLQQCEVLKPELFELIAPLRKFLRSVSRRKHDMNIEMTLADQGVDLGIGNYEPETLEEREGLAKFAQANKLARLYVDGGYGPETQWEPEPVTITLGGIPVSLPQSSFLQPTDDGKAVLVATMLGIVGEAKLIADLFAGLGTFAFALPPDRKVYAAEGSRDAIGALKVAANLSKRQIFTEHRDLYRRPLSADEIDRFQAVILDPPRAGARDQVAQLAQSKIPKICYVSCNPSSFARDAKMLVDAGYIINEIQPVGQFLWSTHVELVAGFSRSD